MVLWYTPEHKKHKEKSWSYGILQKHKKHKGKSPSTFKTHWDEIVVPLTKKKYPGQTPRAGHGTLERGAGASSRIIMTGPRARSFGSSRCRA